MKRLFLVILVASVGAGTYGLVQEETQARRGDRPADLTVRVTRGAIRLVVESTGRVVPELDVEIKCKASGQVIAVPHDVSDVVKEGELLVEIDPSEEDRNVRQARIRLETSRARALQAKQKVLLEGRRLEQRRERAQIDLQAARIELQNRSRTATRQRALIAKSMTSQESHDAVINAEAQARATVEKAEVALKEIEVEEAGLEVIRQDVALAEAQVATDEIAVEAAEQRLRETKVYAPFPGVVSQRIVQEGLIISSPTNNVGGGTTAASMTQTFTMLLGSVAAISLLVGGIGIMNIMLVSVTERTREIGVRKAIGARARDILFQFLVEAVIVSGLGGMIGVAVGVGGSLLVGRFTPFAPVIQPPAVILALSFAVAVGVFFGYYPAVRASRLDPIDALQYE